MITEKNVTFTTTAVNRPEILERTYQSFSTHIKNFDVSQCTLVINIDPLPEADNRNRVVEVANKYFSSVIYNCPDEPNFTRAYNWIFSNASTSFIFNLEDDWIMNEELDIDIIRKKFTKHPNLKQFVLRAYPYTYYSCPLSPSIMHSSMYKAIAGNLDESINPEIQLRHYNFGLHFPTKKKIENKGFFDIHPKTNRVIVQDIGRDWIKKTEFKKPEKKCNFTSWISRPYNIQVVTFMNEKCYDFGNFLYETMNRTAKNKKEIIYNYVELGKTNPNNKDLNPAWQKLCNVAPDKRNSNMHGIAMNKALNHITSDYVIFCDADIAICYPEWDEVVRNELQNNVCFGFDYGDGRRGKFPGVFFFAFRPDKFDYRKLDFTPLYDKSGEKVQRCNRTKYNFSSELYADIIKCDTGWRIANEMHNLLGKFPYNYMQMIKSNSPSVQLPTLGKDVIKYCQSNPAHMSEWHYKGRLFGTHQQAGRSILKQEPAARKWKRRVLAYMDRKEGA